jgi:hypothetical protein
MAISIIGLLVLALIGMLVVGGIVAVVALLANPRTRSAGAAVVAIGLVVVVVGGFLLLGVALMVPAVQRSRVHAQAERARMEAYRGEADLERRAAEMETRGSEDGHIARIPVDVSEDTVSEDTVSEATPAEEPSPADDQPKTPAADGAAEETSAEEPASGGAASAEEAKPPAAEPRPQWVEKPPPSTADVYQMAIKTDPCPTRAECESKLPMALHEAIARYAEAQLNQSSEVAGQLQLTPQYIEQNIVQQKWPETKQISLGKWVQLHVLLQFDQGVEELIEKECEQIQQRLSVTRRLWYGAAGLGAVLAVLAVLFACLKIDQATERPCRGRLTLAAIGALLAVAAAALLAVRFIEAPPAAVHSVDWVPVNSVDSVAAQQGGHEISLVQVTRDHAKAGVVVLPIALLLLGGLVALVAFKKTRAIGLLLLAAVVLAIALGTLHLVA